MWRVRFKSALARRRTGAGDEARGTRNDCRPVSREQAEPPTPHSLILGRSLLHVIDNNRVDRLLAGIELEPHRLNRGEN